MKILLVDEDRASLKALVDSLKARGDFELMAADSAAGAFEAVGDSDGVDVLVTAALMAPQDGFHLSAALRASLPDLRVAYLSKTDLRRHYNKVGDDIVFYKPIDVAALFRWLDGTNEDAVGGGADSQTGSRADGSLQGIRIGDYELQRLLHADDRTETYEATQTSVSRTVAFVVLRDELRRSDPGAVRAFLDQVRAKASVSHQHVAPVYESHEEDEAIYYTRELIDGPDLSALIQKGVQMTPINFVNLVRAVADSLAYMDENGIGISALEAKHIYVGSDNQARLLNIATAGEQVDARSQTEQIKAFSAMVKPLAGLRDPGAERQLVSQLVYMMGHDEDPEVNGSWAALDAAARNVTQELEIGTISELPAVSAKVKQAAAERMKKRVLVAAGGVVALGIVAAFVAAMFPKKTEARAFEEMMRIPAGRFHYQDGDEERELEVFWIDEYEVTIAQYARFLEALDADRSLEPTLNHPEQPESKRRHEPPGWDEYYAAARKGTRYKGQTVDLNHPVTLVDWWDAYAYARWKGRRLPTEEEWEKAARGRRGNLFPWGDRFAAAKLNSSEDYSAEASDETGGGIDGFAFWSPVDAIEADVSDYDVKGMAGNVSEWTSSWTSHPVFPDRQVPVKRGGSFAPSSGYELHVRRTANSPEERSLSLGFRTASSTRPEEFPLE